MAGNDQTHSNWGVLLLAHGSPERIEDIPEYLLRVRGGRPLPEPVVSEIVRRYQLIGGGSPLRRWTERQAELLEQRLGVPVRYGMRNWSPAISEAVAALPPGLERLVVICLAPHNSRTSIGLYRQRLDEALGHLAASPRVVFIENWHDEPHLIAAFAEKLREGLSRFEAESAGAVPVILTAHSVPEATLVAGDPYDRQARETASRVAQAARLLNWRTAFQSQGMASEVPWLGPTVEEEIDEIAEQGHRAVFLAPIGFLCDHAEILYDIDIHFREYARGKGMELRRPHSLNDSPLLIEALASLATQAIKGTGGINHG